MRGNAPRVFCGRQLELRHLQDAYRSVAHAESAGPGLVALVAESGLGKTRIVQEFYRWLSTHEDGRGADGYWPDELLTADSNLQLNPDPATCNNTRPVPFLWWGLRVADPGARNQAIAGQLASSIDALTPHLEPVYRTRRRKEGRKAIGMAVGKTALDVAVDLIPFAGLFKTIGEGAWEIGQEVRGLWGEQQDASAGEIRDRQREDLAARIVSDLGLLLSRETDDVSSVPAVIVIDDGQFSSDDPSIVEFLDRMMAAAIANRWRVLFVVTYWTSEWNRHTAADGEERTIARVILDHRSQFGPAWEPILLAPIDDLSPLLSTALPGLEPPQAHALLERAGGNPRYLDEILRFCERNARLFVGRSLRNPLTAQGLETVMERTVNLHELVEERLQDLAPEVRRAVVLASVQGQEFVSPLVSDVGAVLGDPAEESALAIAEHPHAFIHRQPDQLGAFAQRIFHEVAVAQLGNEFDESEVEEALRAAVRGRLDDVERLEQDQPSVRSRICLLAVRLFADADEETERLRAAFALAQLMNHFEAQHEYELVNRFGRQLAAVLLSIDTLQPYFYFYYLAAESLREQGLYAEGRQLLEKVLPRERRAVADSQGNANDLTLLLKCAGSCSKAFGDLADAEQCFREALEVDRDAAANAASRWAERDLMVSLLNVGTIAENRGDLAAAERDFVEAHDLARRLHAREDSPQSRDDLGVTLVALGDLASARGNTASAEDLYRQRLALDSETASPDTDPARAARRALILERLGGISLDRNDLNAADHALTEALSLRRAIAGRLRTPVAHIDLANVLRQIGDVARAREDFLAAHATYCESLDVIAPVSAEIASPKALRVLSLALERLGRIALMTGQLDQAEIIFQQRLATDRPLAESQRTPAEWRNVLTSLFWLADIAEQRGDADAASAGYRESLELARALAEHLGSPAAHDDLGRILLRLANLARLQGDAAAAERYEQEAGSSGSTVH